MSRTAIISALLGILLLLGGCSALRFGYNQGADIAYWWIDRYVDIEESQSRDLREGIAEWFGWHRASQLPEYAALLARMQTTLAGPVTPGQVCLWVEEVSDRLSVSYDRAVPAMARFARTLTPGQLAHMERKYARNNADYRERFLQSSLRERLEASVARIADRAEMLYGRLDEPQRERVRLLMAQSPFDPEGWLEERQRRQRLVLETLRRIAAEPLPDDEAEAALRRILAHTLRSPRPDYRAYQERLSQYNCDFAAQIHNLATSAQRERAVARLKNWEGDLRALVAHMP